MSPKEKAIELVEKFRLKVLDYDGNGLNGFKAKQCALIAVDEMLKPSFNGYVKMQSIKRYWEEVKSEIEKL